MLYVDRESCDWICHWLLDEIEKVIRNWASSHDTEADKPYKTFSLAKQTPVSLANHMEPPIVKVLSTK